MVSYYNPVAMFGHSGSGHYHPHHQTGTGANPYFTNPYGGYPTPHPHAHTHHVRHGSGAGNGTVAGVTTTQFSPKMTPDFNYNHQYPHQFAHMSPDSAAIAAAASASPWSHTAAAAANVYNPCHRTYDEWSQRQQHNHLHSAFYPHQQPSPPSSNPSPNPNKLSFNGGGVHQQEGESNNATNTANQFHSFKVELGQMSAETQNISQENSSLEMRQSRNGEIPSSVTTTIATPHSPDSGMVISDGVSSSGSPASGMGGGGQHCFGDGGNNMQLASPGTGLNQTSIKLEHDRMMLEGCGEHVSNNLNQQSLHNQQRPGSPRNHTQVHDWMMKKPSYSTSSNSSVNAKTRTKDKYRVVYTDTQRLELEKEFHYNRYINIRRKSELASILGLSERQVKIWFQNRRAKARKVQRKQEELVKRENGAMVHVHPGVMGMGHVNHGYNL